MVLGSADFIGGMASKRARAVVVVCWSNTAGLLTALVLTGVLSRGGTSWLDVFWGGLAGLSGSVGAVLLYRALATGVMSLVAPVTAAMAAALPVVAGVLTGNRLSIVSVTGVLGALASVFLVSLTGDRSGRGQQRRLVFGSLGLALLAGAGFGLFFVFLSRTPSTSSLWPLVWARCASLTLLLGQGLIRRMPLRLPKPTARLALLSGIMDMGSSALYLVAVRGGSLAIIGLLASLYPISTVLLARFVLEERIRVVQRIGVALAMGSVVLLAVN